MTPTNSIPALAVLVMLSCACSPDPDAGQPLGRATLTELPSPAADGSSLPRLTRGPDGKPWLSWVENNEEGAHSLRFSSLRDDGWSAPKTVSTGEDWFVNWADFPSLLVLPEGLMAAHWLTKTPGGSYAYDVTMAISNDAGNTWGEPFSPHDDGTATEHGFVSLFFAGDNIGAVWLDGRNMTGGSGHDGHGHGGMTLRSAVIDRDGSLVHGTEIDGLTCDCCQTGAAVADGVPIVVYRDRTEGEIRDVYVARMEDGRWSPGVLIAEDGWEIAACPVNGPAIDADGADVAVAWFTGAGSPAVKIAFSDDAGATFSPPVTVSVDRPLGRVGVALLEAGRAAVSWLAATEGGAEIRYRIVSGNGSNGPQTIVADTSANRMSGFPQIMAFDGGLLFAWTIAGEPTRIQAAATRPD
jgi:hypothetical protein